MKKLDIDRVNYLFEYRDGDLYRKVKVKCTNIGDKAGCNDHKNYLKTKIDNVSYFNHRIIFFMHHSYLPEFIDHIDGNTLNNRIENLRPATNTQNQWNSKLPNTNTSGVKGVYWVKRDSKWRAMCRVNGTKHHVGVFADIFEAENAINNFRKINHKEFANNAKT